MKGLLAIDRTLYRGAIATGIHSPIPFEEPGGFRAKLGVESFGFGFFFFFWGGEFRLGQGFGVFWGSEAI